MIHTVKGFGIVSKAEIDVFMEHSCFFDNLVDVGNSFSGSSTFSKSSLNIWKFMVHKLLKLDFENFEHYFADVWDEWNCVVVWAFFGIGFLWNWNENWPFPVINSKNLYSVFMSACRNISGVSLLHSIFSFNLAINLKNPPGKILICLCIFSRMCI